MGQKNPIFGAVNEYCVHCRRVNTLLLGQIQQVFDLDKFTGNKSLGCRKGSQGAQVDGELEKCDSEDDDETEDADDVANNQINGILDFVTSL